FFTLLEDWWTKRGQRMKTKGLDGMLEIWRNYFGNVSVKEITQRTVETFLTDHMTKNELTPGTRNRHLAMLRAVFNRGIEWGLVGDGLNPCSKIKKDREAPPRDRFLTPEEIEKLLLHAPNAALRAILVVALHTGMRHGEILQLRWADVDFTNRLVKVRQSKSGKSRSIPMDQTLFDTLKALPTASRFGEFVFPDNRTHCN